jgi:hypothetical protein
MAMIQQVVVLVVGAGRGEGLIRVARAALM